MVFNAVSSLQPLITTHYSRHPDWQYSSQIQRKLLNVLCVYKASFVPLSRLLPQIQARAFKQTNKPLDKLWFCLGVFDVDTIKFTQWYTPPSPSWSQQHPDYHRQYLREE